MKAGGGGRRWSQHLDQRPRRFVDLLGRIQGHVPSGCSRIWPPARSSTSPTTLGSKTISRKRRTWLAFAEQKVAEIATSWR